MNGGTKKKHARKAGRRNDRRGAAAYPEQASQVEARTELCREQVKARLRRIAGQVAGIQRMVEDDRYCMDILLQIAAVRAALGKVGSLLLEAHIANCVREALGGQSDAERESKVAELVQLFEKRWR